MDKTPFPPQILTVTGADQRAGATIVNLLNDGQSSRRLRHLLMAIVGLVAVFVLWSLVAQVDELAKARGEIQPVSRIQLLQSKEGGILSELLVNTDDRVEAGQVIARFATTDVAKERAQAEVRRAGLQIDRELWGAIIEARQPDLGAFTGQAELVQEAQDRFADEKRLNVSLLSAKRSALEEHKAALTGAQSELPTLQRELHLARDVESRYNEGFRRQIISSVRMAEAQEHTANVERTVAQLQARIAELHKAVSTAESELTQAEDEIVQKASAIRAGLLEKIRELDAEVAALDDRQGRTEVVAPVAGFIKQLPDTRVGAVIPPGGTVAELVPSEGGVMMEVLLSPRDIGFVRVGQTALVKVDAFDFSRFGSVSGTVSTISPSAFRQEQTGATYYKVVVQLDKPYVGSQSTRQLIPGMTGEADIVTGSKSVFQYLAKPVFLGADTAFHER
ncbi:HlyD family type I secretion periplasmic adaptor subunit [Pseudomonas turukhanskensis]|uniref:Membrane fusion protein (MFP) family protein n=1 Tax=Pseudomonas turukhanskensis TaxID=1806536 RepID=A0A9W6NHR8_9PSED|nr:HlyD family type I secretion periplasmic adaptor subunit [Pseudomonas turukhanskensis]GLK91046.1 HlyD family type I secretion periplasmic adaptor subunit [Pseudomonas turukhanskensis]